MNSLAPPAAATAVDVEALHLKVSKNNKNGNVYSILYNFNEIFPFGTDQSDFDRFG